VLKVPPGHILTVEGDRPGTPARYFDAVAYASAPPLDPRESEDQLYATLCQVVSQQLRADVPVGLLLSGGIDSSLIAALASREREIRTFSVGFAESEVDERPFARLVSRYIGSQHREFLIAPEDLQAEVEASVPYFDDLFGDWGLVTTRLLYRKCRDEGVKVVIVGEGADELFGGYPIFPATRSGHRFVPTSWTLFQLYRRYAGRRYGRLFGPFRRRMREYLGATAGNLFDAVRLFESRDQLPNNYVMKVDKASMSVSVEARVPYLDPRVAVLAYRIPADQLLRNGTEKHLLRSIARRRGLLPPEIVQRKKFGAAVAASWMDKSHSFRTFALDVILDRSSYWTDALGLRQAMTQYFHAGRTGYRFPSPLGIFRNVAWRLLLLCLWSRHYLTRPA
jgi:asparagine synthase (glutamine-hydrolysing)